MHRIRRLNQQVGRRLSLTALAAVIFLSGVLVGGGGPFVGADSSLEATEAYDTFEQVWSMIQELYVDPGSIDQDKLIYGATSGMVEAVGDTGHTTFIDPVRAASMDVNLTGEYIGIGIEFDFSGALPRAVVIMPDSPAEEAGLRPGDVISEIDGIDVWGMSNAELSDLFTGEAGEAITFKVDRDGQRSFAVTIERAVIDIDPVSWWLIDGHIAHLYLYEFTTGAADQLEQAIADAKGAGADAFILDLRNNGGGRIDELQAVASLFMPTGTPIYLEEDRDGNQSTVAVEDGTEFEYPLIVLVNRGTASSAEITAAAIAEAGVGTTVGETTYGTGTGLAVIPLDDGSYLFLGVVLWLTPSGEQIWKIGYEPEVEIRLLDPVDRLRPQEGEQLGRKDLEASGDTQLRTAVTILDGGLVP